MEKLNAEILLELKKTQDALQESQRSAAIEREMGKYRQKGAKRNIGFCMKLQHKFEDIDFVLKGGSPQIGTERQCVTSKKELFSLML